MAIFRFLRRKWILRNPFPGSLLKILERDVPYYSILPDRLRSVLLERISILLDEKHFEGCGGLEMTEKIKVVIAAYASVLILEETSGYYSDLQSILVYPDDYVAPVHEENDAGIVSEGVEPRKGESWDTGSIILSWRDIENNLHGQNNEQNLILHEFSHQLDQRYGLTAGIGERGEIYRDDEWTRILADAYLGLQKKTRRGLSSVLDPYGCEHPAELFAVATESFWLCPHRLHREYPKLYNILKNFYGTDPEKFVPPKHAFGISTAGI